MDWSEIERNTNLQNVLWHTGIMQYPSPIVNLIDPWTGHHVVLGTSDFTLTDAGTPALGPTAFAKAESRGISAENLQRILGIIMCPEDYRTPGEPEDTSNIDGTDTLGSFLENAIK